MSGKLTKGEATLALDGHGLSIVRRNLLERENYAPYCGDAACRFSMPRTHFDGEQFRCICGWRSDFEPEFIAQFLARWPGRRALKEGTAK